uniref:Membrane insertase YidC/Oxa/ALB C-terminal domain-containing protein n=1 Tax=Clastoptera arizonana TaxID=38151 RepID=A0A1B6E8W1_9HEMI
MFTRSHLRLKYMLEPAFKNFKNEQVAHIHVNYQNNLRSQICNKYIIQKKYAIGAVTILRSSSTDSPTLVSPQIQNSSSNVHTSDIIPEPPVLPTDAIAEGILSEPTFSSLGLGGWGPVGIIQNCMEFLHINCDLPWWVAIVIGTIVVRTLMFPIVIIAQRNSARLNNNLPQLQVLQLKMTEARQRDDKMEAAKYSQETMQFMKEKNVNPLKNMLVPLCQAPVFISFFMSLRGMASVPVDSMRTGGTLWFTDLTLPDQYYALPFITAVTLWITIEVGTDSAKLNSANLNLMKYVLRAMPIIIFPLTINFPGVILVYWTSSNFISLMQVGFLRIPAVRDFFKIEKLIEHDKQTLPVKEKGFVNSFKDSWSNMKISNELHDRQRSDHIKFMQAGRGAVKKTYKFDPTQSRPNSSVISARKKES